MRGGGSSLTRSRSCTIPPEEQVPEIAIDTLRAYRGTLPYERRVLLDRYHLEDIANKVVGVGSVGTWCGVALFLAEDNDPLFLQIKEARPSRPGALCRKK